MKYCKRKVIQGLDNFYRGDAICEIFIEGRSEDHLSKYLGKTGIFWYPDNESSIEIENLKLFEQAHWEF